jgi:hypothetical protein
MKKDLGVYMPISIHGEHGSAIHEDGEEATFIKKHRGRIIVFFEDDHGPLIYPIRLKRYEKIK